MDVGSRYVKSVPVKSSQGATITVSPQESDKLAGTALAIQPNALKSDTLITLELGLKDMVDIDSAVAGPVALWGPGGTQFAPAAEMTLPLVAGADVDLANLFVQVQEDNGTRFTIATSELRVDLANKLVSFSARGFSKYQVRGKKCNADDPTCGQPGTIGGGTPGKCTDNAPCADGTKCVNGACQKCNDPSCGQPGTIGGGTPGKCTDNTPCSDGTKCVNGVCVK